MDIEELRKEGHLSASSINTYVECGLLYKLSRIDRLESESTSDALELGSAIHRALADFNQARIEGGYLSLQELHNRFEQYWSEAIDQNQAIQYRDGKDAATLLREGKGLLSAYHQGRQDDGFKVIAIEQPFRFELEGLNIPLIGIFDLVEEDPSGAIVIIDFKTTSRAYSFDEVDRNFQMTVYHLAAKAQGYHEREILLRFDCMIKTKKPRFEQYYTSRGPLEEKRAIKKIISVWQGINQGVFIPNDLSWKCSGCGYKTYCEHWFSD